MGNTRFAMTRDLLIWHMWHMLETNVLFKVMEVTQVIHTDTPFPSSSIRKRSCANQWLQQSYPNLFPQRFCKDRAWLAIFDFARQKLIHHYRGPPRNGRLFPRSARHFESTMLRLQTHLTLRISSEAVTIKESGMFRVNCKWRRRFIPTKQSSNANKQLILLQVIEVHFIFAVLLLMRFKGKRVRTAFANQFQSILNTWSMFEHNKYNMIQSKVCHHTLPLHSGYSFCKCSCLVCESKALFSPIWKTHNCSEFWVDIDAHTKPSWEKQSHHERWEWQSPKNASKATTTELQQ